MKLLNYPVLFLIFVYRKLISPMLPNSCRFTPTCSSYSYAAFKQYNFFKAMKLSIFRIAKCHPFHPGGDDPLP